MDRHASCQYCRWFATLRAGAVIGRCGNEQGGHSFPRKEACCPEFEAERRTSARGEQLEMPIGPCACPPRRSKLSQ
jgi:hypothetical protein